MEVAFSRPLRIGPAQDPANYAIVGPDGQPLAIASAAYDPATDSVTLTTRQPLRPGRPYRITVNGLRVGGVVDVYGIPLDGTRIGRPGALLRDDPVAGEHRGHGPPVGDSTRPTSTRKDAEAGSIPGAGGSRLRASHWKAGRAGS